MYSKLIRDIMDTMQRENVPIELVDDLAAEFAEACEVANARMSEVAQLLSAGYRDEAIAMAEQSPRLLDLFSELDFPQREQWQTFLYQRGRDGSFTLMTHHVQDLEFAYQISENIQSVLKKHRLLALTRAPIRSRLSILRSLAERDPANPIWRDDVKKFELERLNEMTKEFRALKSANDLDGIKDLMREINGEWTIQIPRGLRHEVHKKRSELERNSTRNKMEEVATKLNECLVQFDYERGRQLRQEWLSLNESIQITTEDPIYHQAYEPLLWLQEEDQAELQRKEIQQKVNHTYNLLQKRCSLERLDRHILELEMIDVEVPESLQNKIDQYRQSLISNKRTRSLLTIAIGALVLSGILAGVVWAWNAIQHASQINSSVTELSNFSEDANFQQAANYYEKLSPTVQADQRVQRVWQELQEQKDTLRKKDQMFEVALKQYQADTSLGESKSRLLEQLTQLASSEQLNQITEIKDDLQARRLARQRVRERTFRQEFAERKNSVAQLLNSDTASISTTVLLDLRNDYNIWLNRFRGQADGLPFVSKDLIAKANELAQQISVQTKLLSDKKRRNEQLNRLDESVGDPGRFGHALEAFVEQNPSDEMTSSFQKSAKEQWIWSALQRWQTLAEDPKWNQLNSISSEEAELLLDQIRLAKPNEPQFPFAKKIRETQKLLNEKISGKPNSASFTSSIRSIFDNPMYRDLNVLVESGQQTDKRFDDVRYYVKSTDDGRQKIQFDYYADKTLLQTKSNSVLRRKVQTEGLAGHCLIGRKILEVLASSQFTTEQERAIAVLGAALDQTPGDAETDLDLYVQALMVHHILTQFKQSQIAFGNFVDRYLERLQKLEITKHDWARPTDEQALIVREQLEDQLMSRMVKDFNIEKVRAQAMAGQPPVVAEDWRSSTKLNWVGWLKRTDSGEFEVSTKQEKLGPTTFYCLVPDTGGLTIVDFIVVGTHSANGVTTFEPDSPLVAGRPVYVRE